MVAEKLAIWNGFADNPMQDHMEVTLTQSPSNVRRTILANPSHKPVEVRLPTGGSTIRMPEPITLGNGKARESGPLRPEQIVKATAACFAEHGYDGTTIRIIAARLGCAVGSIYRHFDDKRALLLAVAERAIRPALQAIEHGASVEVSIERYIACAAEHSELYRLMFWLVGQGDGADLPATVTTLIDHWAAGLGGAAAARQRWAMVHGTLMLGERPTAHIATPVVEPRNEPPPAPIADQQVDEDDVTLL